MPKHLPTHAPTHALTLGRSAAAQMAAGLFWAAAAILIWSGSLVLMRYGVTTSLTAYDVTALRFGVAAALIGPFVIGRSRREGAGGWPTLWVCVALCLLFGAPYIALVCAAMETASARAAGALNPGVMAVAAILGAWLAFGDRLGRVQAIGGAAALAGLGLFLSLGEPFRIGHGILIVTGGMWAAYGLVLRAASVSAWRATAIVAIGSAVLYLPLYAALAPSGLATAAMHDIALQAGFQGVLVSLVAVYAFSRSVELLGPIIGGGLPALIPVVTAALGAAFLGERPSGAEMGAMLLLCGGVLMILSGKAPAPHPGAFGRGHASNA